MRSGGDVARPPGTSFSVRGLVQAGAAVLIGLLLVTAVTGWAVRELNRRATHVLDTHIAPAEIHAVDLRGVYREVHIAQAAFQLTGAPGFAAASDAGFQRATLLGARIKQLLSGDPAASTSLAATQAAASRWHFAAREADRARIAGTASPNDIIDSLRTEKRLYSLTSRRLDAARLRITELWRSQLASVSSRQTLSTVISWSALAAAMLVALAAMTMLRRKLTRPLDSLLCQVDAVSAGDTERPISLSSAPTELSGIAAASERMRTSLLRNARGLADAQRQLAVHQERDRFADDLHDHTVQEVFALSLTLTSTASRSTEMARLLEPLIEQTDRIIRRFRAIIFDVKEPVTSGSLSDQLQTVATTSARALGFTPRLTINPTAVDDGVAPQVAGDLVAVLRESLSNVARHAHATRVDVDITTDQDIVQLRVSDDGDGLPSAPILAGQGLQSLRDRARRLGGTAQIASRPGSGTTVVWQVRNGDVHVHPSTTIDAASAADLRPVAAASDPRDPGNADHTAGPAASASTTSADGR